MGEKHRNTSSRIKIGTTKLRHIGTDTQNKSKWAGHSDKGIYPERQGCKDTELIYLGPPINRDTQRGNQGHK